MSQPHLRLSSQSRRLIKKLAAHSTWLGVSFALHSAARANVIFTDLGPDGVAVRDGTFDIDLNADGLTDFVIKHDCSGSTTPATSTDCDVSMEGRNGGKAIRFNNTIRFEASAEIDPLLAQSPRVFLVSFNDFSSTSRGPFACTSSGNSCPGGRRGFLGVAIPVDGAHAGWIDVYASGYFGFTVFGFAYETTPGKPIPAGAVPEPPSLVLLAAGATGLRMLRRKRRSPKSESAPSGR